MRFFSLVSFSMLFFFLSSTGYAEQLVFDLDVGENTSTEKVLYTDVKILSASSSLSFEDIKIISDTRFHFYQNEKFNKDSTYWLKLTIRNRGCNSGAYYLHFNDLLSHISLYQLLNDSTCNEATGGILVPLAQRSLKGSIKDKVPFWLYGNQTTTIFLKIRNRLGNVNILGNLKIISENSFDENKANINFLQGAFLGILLLLLSFNFILFVFSRNPLYLYYALYIAAYVLFLANVFQISERFLFANHPPIDIYTQWAYLVAQLIYLLFFIEILKFENLLLWRKFSIWFGVFMSAFLLVLFIISIHDYRTAMILCDYFSLINVCYILVSFFVLYKKVRLTTKLILVGAVFTVIGALITIVLSFSESFILNIFYFELGVVIELIFFTIAINYTYTMEVQKNKFFVAKAVNENKTLKEEIDDKNRDLITKSLIIQEKENLLLSMINQLSMISESDRSLPNIRKITSGLKYNLSTTPWSEVEIHFNKVHPQFYAALQKHCSNLTLNERKLCAFLKFNLTTKEIAAVTGKSENTINVARSRMRKKLGLNESDNLQSFIANISIPKG